MSCYASQPTTQAWCVCSCWQANCGQLLDGVQLMHLCVWPDWQWQDPHHAGLHSGGCGGWNWRHRSSGTSVIVLRACDHPFSELCFLPSMQLRLESNDVLEVYACKDSVQVPFLLCRIVASFLVSSKSCLPRSRRSRCSRWVGFESQLSIFGHFTAGRRYKAVSCMLLSTNPKIGIFTITMTCAALNTAQNVVIASGSSHSSCPVNMLLIAHGVCMHVDNCVPGSTAPQTFTD